MGLPTSAADFITIGGPKAHGARTGGGTGFTLNFSELLTQAAQDETLTPVPALRPAPPGKNIRPTSPTRLLPVSCECDKHRPSGFPPTPDRTARGTSRRASP